MLTRQVFNEFLNVINDPSATGHHDQDYNPAQSVIKALYTDEVFLINLQVAPDFLNNLLNISLKFETVSNLDISWRELVGNWVQYVADIERCT